MMFGNYMLSLSDEEEDDLDCNNLLFYFFEL